MSAAAPVDLRLVPAVLVAFAAAWCVTGPARGWAGAAAVVGVVGLALVGFALASRTWIARLRSPRSRTARVATARSRTAGAPGAGTVAHVVLALACLAAVGTGAHVQLARQEPLAAAAGSGALVHLTGRVASEPRPAVFGPGSRWVLATSSVTVRGAATGTAGLVEVTAPGDPPRYGALVALRGVLRVEGPGDGVLARTSVDGPVPERAPPGAALRATDRLRSALLQVTDPLSEQARGLVPGVAVGDTSRLSPDLDEAMRTTSLTHVTAVSGGHFAIVVATLTALCAALRVPRVVRVLAVATVAVGFVLLVRPEPSVLRAAWTCAVGLLGLALGRPSAGLPALGAAAIALLVVDPWLARSYGFVLSCAATAGLVLLAGPLARRLAPWTGRPLAFALAVPWAAQAACGPVLMLLDPRVPLTSVPANLLAAPALVPATVLGLVATLLAPWAPGPATAVGWCAGLATGWIAMVARWFAALPWASVPWPGGIGGALALALLTGVSVVLVLRRGPAEGWPRRWKEAGPRVVDRACRAVRRRRDRRQVVHLLLLAGAGAAGLALIVAAAAPRLGLVPGAVPDDWQVAACDVGQGDALVVRTGPASGIVVDVGPEGGAAGRCLDHLGVERVDLLVLSHFHADHVGGLPAVLRGRTVTEALVSPLEAPAGQAEAAHVALDDAGVPVRAASPGDQGSVGDVGWQVLGSGVGGGVISAASVGGGGGGAEGDRANDASVSLRVRTASGLDVVALGDLEEPGQDALLRSLAAVQGSDLAGVDVVKMAHHGSRAQSAALAGFLAPRVALVSVGVDNTYGHPTRDALDLYAGVGSAVVRTDECGTAVLVDRGGEIGLACTSPS
ncbi:ComEC/Rec2 family competence protein [Isoptericola sp. NEAU-Y5]|uniref:ComEC/Rec2 family competence protein n=1 Tax=Isoptericola luteus TaxID=2879484 RepID=A0ABS7ZIY9_9MICO|nr:ComEC/Rec2 family competence protein [Isoptericola sp. NEAU-Y5]MCA5893764.1 ComEC/Rec2 family competence protein [Isoptericola sp. NEAU-Y5]